MKTVVFLSGIHSLGFAVFHCFFWKIFNWKEDLRSASIPTRAIIQIANLRLIYLFLFFASLCFFYSDELLETRLGHAILFGMSLFWLGRLVEQYLFLRYNRPMIHLLSALFAMGSLLFALPLFQ